MGNESWQILLGKPKFDLSWRNGCVISFVLCVGYFHLTWCLDLLLNYALWFPFFLSSPHPCLPNCGYSFSIFNGKGSIYSVRLHFIKIRHVTNVIIPWPYMTSDFIIKCKAKRYNNMNNLHSSLSMLCHECLVSTYMRIVIDIINFHGISAIHNGRIYLLQWQLCASVLYKALLLVGVSRHFSNFVQLRILSARVPSRQIMALF